MRSFWPVAVVAALTGCGGGGASRDASISREVEQTVREADSRAAESRTLSALARIEDSVAAYVKSENSIPGKLDDLVPRYLAEIPAVELGVRGHRDTAKVQIYPGAALRDGQIDGSQLKDTGRWGYVHNERQVVVFIDCTHQSPRRQPWYQTRGVH
jgi:hypothetical protein